MSYTVYLKRSKQDAAFIATDNLSTVYGFGKTLKDALEDYEGDVREFLGVCDQKYGTMSYSLQEECNRLRTELAADEETAR